MSLTSSSAVDLLVDADGFLKIKTIIKKQLWEELDGFQLYLLVVHTGASKFSQLRALELKWKFTKCCDALLETGQKSANDCILIHIPTENRLIGSYTKSRECVLLGEKLAILVCHFRLAQRFLTVASTAFELTDVYLTVT